MQVHLSWTDLSRLGMRMLFPICYTIPKLDPCEVGIALFVAWLVESTIVCVAAQWPTFFQLPVLMLMLITLLNDGTLISIGYDNVVPNPRPDKWNLRVSTPVGRHHYCTSI